MGWIFFLFGVGVLGGASGFALVQEIIRACGS